MENSSNYELIIAIVNKGFTDLVMDAAKEKGARGGTTFNAHGTGNKSLEDFFGITIQPEKEVVFILVKEEIKDDVLLAIYKAVGLETKGNGIAFALKVEDVVGLSSEVKEKIEEIKEEIK